MGLRDEIKEEQKLKRQQSEERKRFFELLKKNDIEVSREKTDEMMYPEDYDEWGQKRRFL